MKHVAALLMIAALTASGAHAQPTLLCRRPEVVDEVARTVRQWNAYNTVDAASVTETPTAFANAVICHAAIDGVGYVRTAEGWAPRRTREIRRYDVQVAGNRFTVQVPR